MARHRHGTQRASGRATVDCAPLSRSSKMSCSTRTLPSQMTSQLTLSIEDLKKEQRLRGLRRTNVGQCSVPELLLSRSKSYGHSGNRLSRVSLKTKMGEGFKEYAWLLQKPAMEIFASRERDLSARGVAHRTVADFKRDVSRMTVALAAGRRKMTRQETFKCHFTRAFACSRLDQNEKALADYTECIRLVPDNGAAHFNRSEVLTKLERVHEAIRDLTTALRIDPSNATTFLHNRALLHRKVGHFEQAMADYESAEKIRLKNEAVAGMSRRKRAEPVRSAAEFGSIALLKSKTGASCLGAVAELLRKDRYERTASDCEEIAILLTNLLAFKGVPLDLLQELAKIAQYVAFPEGAFVFEQGDVGSDVFVVLSGAVKVLKSKQTSKRSAVKQELNELMYGEEAHRQEDVIATLRPGASFGELGDDDDMMVEADESDSSSSSDEEDGSESDEDEDWGGSGEVHARDGVDEDQRNGDSKGVAKAKANARAYLLTLSTASTKPAAPPEEGGTGTGTDPEQHGDDEASQARAKAQEVNERDTEGAHLEEGEKSEDDETDEGDEPEREPQDDPLLAERKSRHRTTVRESRRRKASVRVEERAEMLMFRTNAAANAVLNRYRAWQIQDRMQALRCCTVFQSWSEEKLLRLAKRAMEQQFSPGANMIVQGEPVRELFVLRTGLCKVMKRVKFDATQARQQGHPIKSNDYSTLLADALRAPPSDQQGSGDFKLFELGCITGRQVTGEFAVLENTRQVPSPVTVQAGTSVDALVLAREDLSDIIADFYGDSMARIRQNFMLSCMPETKVSGMYTELRGWTRQKAHIVLDTLAKRGKKLPPPPQDLAL